MQKIIGSVLFVSLFIAAIIFGPSLWYAVQKPTHYGDLIHGKVSTVSERFSGDGALYQTSDPKAIAQLVHTLESISYYPTKSEQVTGASTTLLLDQNGQVIGAFSFSGPDTIDINGKSYRMDPNPDVAFRAFFSEFITPKNVSK
ncbi:MAG: hypothetical protein ACXVO1_09735 [Tumebacillaceae bacterium]